LSVASKVTDISRIIAVMYVEDHFLARQEAKL